MENKDVVQPVAENLEAQTLQPEIVVETAKEEAAQQAEQMAAEQTQQVAEQGFRPNKKQTAVAVMFVAGAVLTVLNIFSFMMVPYGDLIMLLNWLPNMIFAVSWLMLAFLAVNKAVRVASFIGTGVSLFAYLYLLPAFAMNKIAQTAIALVIMLALCYAVSLLQTNGGIKGHTKTWVNLIALEMVLSFSFSLSIISVGLSVGLSYVPVEDLYFASPYYSFFSLLILELMFIISYWKLARCEAFSGKYDGEAVVDFSPVNKWMAMAVVVPVVIAIAMIVIYSNTSWFI